MPAERPIGVLLSVGYAGLPLSVGTQVCRDVGWPSHDRSTGTTCVGRVSVTHQPIRWIAGWTAVESMSGSSSNPIESAIQSRIV